MSECSSFIILGGKSVGCEHVSDHDGKHLNRARNVSWPYESVDGDLMEPPLDACETVFEVLEYVARHGDSCIKKAKEQIKNLINDGLDDLIDEVF